MERTIIIGHAMRIRYEPRECDMRYANALGAAGMRYVKALWAAQM